MQRSSSSSTRPCFRATLLFLARSCNDDRNLWGVAALYSCDYNELWDTSPGQRIIKALAALVAVTYHSRAERFKVSFAA